MTHSDEYESVEEENKDLRKENQFLKIKVGRLHDKNKDMWTEVRRVNEENKQLRKENKKWLDPIQREQTAIRTLERKYKLIKKKINDVAREEKGFGDKSK